MNTHEMIAVMQAYEDGKQIEFMHPMDGEWSLWERDRAPNWNWDHYTYRIKATKKPAETPVKRAVDLSVLIAPEGACGIDCEFKDCGHDKWKEIGALKNIAKDDFPYEGARGYYWEHCRPRMNHIHAWQGGECPLPEGIMVKCVYRDKLRLMAAQPAESWDWKHYGKEGDIIAFEVIGLGYGYCWPWECDE